MFLNEKLYDGKAESVGLNRKHEMFLNFIDTIYPVLGHSLNHKHEMFLNTYLENPHISEEFINCKHIIFLYFYYFSYL